MRLIREKRGLSQEQLAFDCELDRTYVSSVDRGLRNISLCNIWRLSDALKVNPSVFFVPEPEFVAILSGLEQAPKRKMRRRSSES